MQREEGESVAPHHLKIAHVAPTVLDNSHGDRVERGHDAVTNMTDDLREPPNHLVAKSVTFAPLFSDDSFAVASSTEYDSQGSAAPAHMKSVRFATTARNDTHQCRREKARAFVTSSHLSFRGGSLFSIPSIFSSRSTIGRQHSLFVAKTKKWYLSARYFKLFIGTFLGVLALFVSSYRDADDSIYGRSLERKWLWWCVAVPFNLFAATYFARFAGSFLMRIWIWELVNSPWVHEAFVSLWAGVLSEEAADMLFVSVLAKPVVPEATSTLTAAVVSCHDVQEACAHAVQMTLQSPEVDNAAAMFAIRLLEKPGLRRATAGFIGNEALVDPLSSQVARVVKSEEVGRSVASFLERVLEDQKVRRIIKRRAESVVRDAEVFSAGKQGLCEAMASFSQVTSPARTCCTTSWSCLY